MARSVSLSPEMMDLIRAEAAIQRRTLAGQVRHWVRIGRAVEESGALDYRQIRELLQTFDDQGPTEDDTGSDREAK